MKVTKPLPSPPDDALTHSSELQNRICNAIEKNGGSISFRQYMEMALYEPGYGYYVAGLRKIGKGGDFVTAPEISSFFSQCVANQCQQILQALGRGDILELGAGTGVMAADILLQLEYRSALPDNYYILDLSPELKATQRQTLETKVPHLVSRVTWLDTLPEQPISGLIIGNEVLDAMPVELFNIKGNEIFQQRVKWENNRLVLDSAPADNKFKSQIDRLKITAQHAYTSEFNPNIQSWMEQLDCSLQAGLILLIDYGYPRNEYYHPDRTEGTLICHYQQLVHNEYFWYPGLQDITANVDFTHVAEAADNKGLNVSGFTSQAAFLANCGLEELFIQALSTNPEQQYQFAQQIRTLSLPSEMGERFKVIALGKALNIDLIGFSTLDQRHKL